MCLRFTVALVFCVWCFIDFGVTTVGAYGNCTQNSCTSPCVQYPSCSASKKGNGRCMAVCKPRCVCNTGYVYNSAGHCVLPQDCP